MVHRSKGCVLLFNAIVSIFILFRGQVSCSTEQSPKKSYNVFPILMYNTDIGVGFGAKGKFVNFLGQDESFDLLLFNSTKGERTYVFVFSLPDFEIRLGTTYSFSFDLKAEYSKLLKANFCGLGPDSEKKDLTRYTDEKKELILTWGKGLNPHFVIEAMCVLKSIRYFNIEEDKSHTETLDGVGEDFSPYITVLVRYDTSDSWIHPKKGLRILLRNDLATSFLGNSRTDYIRYTLDLRKYLLLIGQNDVLAFRFVLQQIIGEDVPLYEMSVLGGSSEMTAMRGYMLNRFKDKGKFLINTEYRFPLWERLGGNIFVDWGLVWPSWKKIRFDLAAKNFGWGLRYYLKNFVVRFDMGFSSEGTGIHFNFGHIF
ncbi:MAG: BamA/TamA family outer membrane protein [Candidatus Aminicenantes bacterium]